MPAVSRECAPIVADKPDGDMLNVVVRTIRDLDPSDDFFPLRAAAASEELEIVLTDPAALQLAADHVREAAEKVHADSVLGASQVGNRLAAAAVARGGTLRMFAEATPGGHVLLVDSVLVTGYQLRLAEKLVRRYGATAVSACVLADASGGESVVESLDSFVILAVSDLPAH